MKKILVLATIIAVFASMLAMPLQAVQADGSVVYVNNLQPSWTAPGGGGVYSSYAGYPDYAAVSPGTTAIYDGRESGIIKAGLTPEPDGHYWDDCVFAFIPNVTINVLAAGTLTYDVQNEHGENPVWMTIEIDTGVVGNRNDNYYYQCIPAPYTSGWHTVNANDGTAQWQAVDLYGSGNGFGPMMTLGQVVTANTSLNVVRTYLRLGMGDSYHGTAGLGTVAWVDKATIGGVTYDFVVNAGTASTTGTMVEGSISIVAPTLPGFGTFHAGNNDIVSSPDGSVTVIPGSNGNTGWSVTAISNPLDAGYMWTWNSNPARVQRLVTELQISNGGAYQNADTALTYTGSGNTANAFPLWARQVITSGDTTMGLYSITITFTASLTGF